MRIMVEIDEKTRIQLENLAKSLFDTVGVLRDINGILSSLESKVGVAEFDNKLLARLADVEVKTSKLYGALIEYTPNGKEKPSTVGKAISETLRDRLRAIQERRAQ